MRSAARKSTDAKAAEIRIDFLLDDFLPYRLSVSASRVARLFGRRLGETFGLSIPEWRVLAVLGRVGTASPSAVGEMTAMDKVKVSRAAASLVGRGMVRQTQDPHDGRARVLRLTRKGTTTCQQAVPMARELETQMAAGLSRTEWSAMHKTLNRMIQHVDSLSLPSGDDGDG